MWLTKSSHGINRPISFPKRMMDFNNLMSLKKITNPLNNRTIRMSNDPVGCDKCNGTSRIHLKNNPTMPFIPSQLETIKGTPNLSNSDRTITKISREATLKISTGVPNQATTRRLRPIQNRPIRVYFNPTFQGKLPGNITRLKLERQWESVKSVATQFPWKTAQNLENNSSGDRTMFSKISSFRERQRKCIAEPKIWGQFEPARVWPPFKLEASQRWVGAVKKDAQSEGLTPKITQARTVMQHMHHWLVNIKVTATTSGILRDMPVETE